MNKKEIHVMTGMTRDTAVQRFNPNMAFDARNIRLTAKGENSVLLSVTNEKGTKEITLEDQINGTVIGTASFADAIVVFSTIPDSQESAKDFIYCIKDLLTETPEISVLFEGDLSFDVQHPLETLAIVENAFIRKVYWVDGINQPRMINIENYADGPETNPDKFNFVRDIDFTNQQIIEVTKNPAGGNFPTGTIQYCFTYFDKFGQQTAPVSVSPLYYLSPTDRGLPEDGTASNSFIIKIPNPDTKFEYVRVYAILRTSENATPMVRIVGDYSCTNTQLEQSNSWVEIPEIGFNSSNMNDYYFTEEGGESPIFLSEILALRQFFDILDDSEISLSSLEGAEESVTLSGNWSSNTDSLVIIDGSGRIIETLSTFIYNTDRDSTLEDLKYILGDTYFLLDKNTGIVYFGYQEIGSIIKNRLNFVPTAGSFPDYQPEEFRSEPYEVILSGFASDPPTIGIGYIYYGDGSILRQIIEKKYLHGPNDTLYKAGEKGFYVTPEIIVDGDWLVEGNIIPGGYALYQQQISEDEILHAVDTGEHGETVDATLLLFLLGHQITAKTLAAKDNTLFLGNLKDNSEILGTKKIGETQLVDLIKGCSIESIYTNYDGKYDPSSYITINNDGEVTLPNGSDANWIKALEEHQRGTSGTSFYDYEVNNNRSSRQLKSFKYGENYRLGLIAQDNKGRWSEVLWIKDATEAKRPIRTLVGTDGNNNFQDIRWYNNVGFRAEIPSNIVSFLKENNYENIAPVVVYPQNADRIVIAQGILAGTVYNVKDRADNSPYVQADWRFRMGYSWKAIREEIQICSWEDYPDYPEYTVPSGKKYIPEEFENRFGEAFYRDPTIVTFHSPDIEFSDDLRNGDFLNTYLRLTGFSTLQFTAANTDTETLGLDYGFSEDSVSAGFAIAPELHRAAFLRTSSPGFAEFSTVKNIEKTFKDFAKRNDPNEDYFPTQEEFKALQFGGYLDVVSQYTNSGELTPATGIEYSEGESAYLGFYWRTYLWHRNGSLNNQPPLTTTAKKTSQDRTALLERKCISELRYARTYWQGTLPTINIGTPKIADSSQNTMLRVSSLENNEISYYSNIDKVLVPNFIDTSAAVDDSSLTEGAVPHNISFPDGQDKTKGYSIKAISSEYVQAESETGFVPVIYNMFRPVKSLKSYYKRDNEKFNRGKDPVLMRYKTTPHLVIPLYSRDETLLGSLAPNTFTGRVTGAENISNFFWAKPEQEVAVYGITSGDKIKFNNNILYIADLCRNFTSEQMQFRFGGTSKEALASNDWVICGEVKSLTRDAAETGSVYLDYVEGDTYVMRYDCLKSYPYTQEDPNSIVSIFSTELETRVNLDFKYDRNRGLSDNTLVTPENFNLFNRPGYEQTNQYFTYHALDYDRYKKLQYPNMITWSLEKTNGEDIDTWCSIPLTSTLDLDGEKGEVTALKLFRNEIFAFQNTGISQILFNSRVQIPTSDGQPIEISNGFKVQGKRYITDNIGVTNKWSIVATHIGLYFIDDERNSIYRFGGEGLEDISLKFGFRTWLHSNNSYGVWNPRDYTNLRTFYDKANMDLYFTTKDEALVFSEQLNTFISFMDYGDTETLFNFNDKFYAFRKGNTHSSLHELWAGPYNMFFGEFKPYWLGFVSNADATIDKVFNTLEWRTVDYTNIDAEVEGSGTLAPMSTFDTLRVWHEHQDTGNVELTNVSGRPSTLKKKFNVFRSFVPRDIKGHWAQSGRDRIRNPWAFIQLSRYKENTDMMQFTELSVDYFL